MMFSAEEKKDKKSSDFCGKKGIFTVIYINNIFQINSFYSFSRKIFLLMKNNKIRMQDKLRCKFFHIS